MVNQTKIEFNNYKSFLTFLEGLGSKSKEFTIQGINLGLQKALIDSGSSLSEARNFLEDDIEEENITQVRVYNDRVIFQIDNVTFTDDELAYNSVTGFIIGYSYNLSKQSNGWFWIDLL